MLDHMTTQNPLHTYLMYVVYSFQHSALVMILP